MRADAVWSADAVPTTRGLSAGGAADVLGEAVALLEVDPLVLAWLVVRLDRAACWLAVADALLPAGDAASVAADVLADAVPGRGMVVTALVGCVWSPACVDSDSEVADVGSSVLALSLGSLVAVAESVGLLEALGSTVVGSWLGVVDVAVGLGATVVEVAVGSGGLGITVGLGVGVVGSSVAVGVGVGSGVAVAVAVLVGSPLDVAVLVGVTDSVGTPVGVLDSVGPRLVSVGVPISVAVGDGVSVAVGVVVSVGVALAELFDVLGLETDPVDGTDQGATERLVVVVMVVPFPVACVALVVPVSVELSTVGSTVGGNCVATKVGGALEGLVPESKGDSGLLPTWSWPTKTGVMARGGATSTPAARQAAAAASTWAFAITYPPKTEVAAPVPRSGSPTHPSQRSRSWVRLRRA